MATFFFFFFFVFDAGCADSTDRLIFALVSIFAARDAARRFLGRFCDSSIMVSLDSMPILRFCRLAGVAGAGAGEDTGVSKDFNISSS